MFTIPETQITYSQFETVSETNIETGDVDIQDTSIQIVQELYR